MKLRGAAVCAVAVFALSACGTDSSSTPAVVDTTATSQSDESQSGSNIDNFVAKTVSGESFVLTNALAQKPVVLWFWAPGCGTCNSEAPSVEEAQKKFAESVTVVGVAWAGDQSSYQSFVDRHGLTFINLDDTPGDVYSKYKVPYQPAWVFIDKDGTATTRVGVIGDSELSQLIQKMN